MTRAAHLVGDVVEIHFPYDPLIVDAVRAIPDRRYKDMKRGKFWTVPASPFHIKELLAALKPFGFDIDPKLKSLTKEAKPPAVPIRAAHTRNLYPFQVDGVRAIAKAGGRIILADQMGLGKTVQSLSYAKARGEDVRRLLVVAPASVIYKWKNECARWLGDDWDAEVVDKGKGQMPKARALIMSYAIATARYHDIMAWSPDMIIADEAHAIKGNKSARTRAFKQYAATVPYLLFLTASPFLNRPQELWNMLHIIDPAVWNNEWNFLVRYCGMTRTPWGYEMKGATNQDELANRLQPVMVRRLKEDVLDQLPAMRREVMPVRINMKEYQAARKQRTQGNALAWLNELRQIVGRGKAPIAIEWAKDFLDGSDEKLVIYAHHHEVITQLELGLAEYGVSTITGHVDNKERAARVEAFQTKEQPRVMVISSAGGEGIDLYRAATLLFVEREWTPMAEEQVEGRLHRIGQSSPVVAYYLAAEKTMDEHLAKLVDEKRAIFHEIVGTTDIETMVRKEILEALE